MLGFPRSGTTLLQNLLEQAPSRRALRFWELTNPIPEHEEPSRDRAARVRRAERDLTWAYWFVPEMEEMHEVRADTAEECWPLLANTWSVLNFDICHGLVPYGDWLLKQEMAWAYREYRRQLQLLLWRERVDQLVLKCPEHLWFLDSVLEAFPDACIVWTHRDPLDCVASYSSLISLSRRTLQGRIDPAQIGPHIADRFHQGVERAMAARDAIGDESRFFDVNFRELVADPVGMTNRIEERFGLDPTDHRLLDDWLTKKRADAPGRHRYDPAMWDLHAIRFARSSPSTSSGSGSMLPPSPRLSISPERLTGASQKTIANPGMGKRAKRQKRNWRRVMRSRPVDRMDRLCALTRSGTACSFARRCPHSERELSCVKR